MVGIYKIENLLNGKVYIGQSRCIEKRWINHRSAAFNPNNQCYDYPLYCAIRKYGIENFSFEIIEKCEIKLLNDRELYWIEYFQAYGKNGYNQTQEGSLAHSGKLSQEDIEEIKQSLMNTQISQYELAKRYNVNQTTISNINTGKSCLDEKITYPIRKQESHKNYCIKCGKEILSQSKKCKKCAGEDRRRVERPCREELKEIIRTKPFTKIGEAYGVSDNTIRKWCKDNNLPFNKKDIMEYSDEEWLSL